jgi:hypothetical protein
VVADDELGRALQLEEKGRSVRGGPIWRENHAR